MNPLIVKSTEYSPKVTFNPEESKFEIAGESRPENAGKLYGIAMEWLKEYLSSDEAEKKTKSGAKGSQLLFEFNLMYFNTVSAKYILEILRLLHFSYSKGFDIKVQWHYKVKDEDMKESGEEFSRLVNIPFEFIQD